MWFLATEHFFSFLKIKTHRRPPLPQHVLVLITTNKINVFVKTRFCHGWAQYGRWEGHRTAKIQVVAMHVFFSFIIFHEKMFSGPWTFPCVCVAVVRDFCRKISFSKNGPEVSGSGWGGITDLLGPIVNPVWSHKSEMALNKYDNKS